MLEEIVRNEIRVNLVNNLVRNPLFIKNLPKCVGIELELLFNLLYLQDLDHNLLRLTKETKPYLYHIFKEELEDGISKSFIQSEKADNYSEEYKTFGKPKLFKKRNKRNG